MAKKKFVVFENYQGMGEIKILKGLEVREADEPMDILREEIDRKNGEDKANCKREGIPYNEPGWLLDAALVKVTGGVILRLSEDEVNDIYVLEIKE